MAEKKPCSGDWKEERRQRALALKQAGWRQCEIAAALDVTPSAVRQWMRRVEEEGEQALKTHPHSGAVALNQADQRGTEFDPAGVVAGSRSPRLSRGILDGCASRLGD